MPANQYNDQRDANVRAQEGREEEDEELIGAKVGQGYCVEASIGAAK